MPTSDSEDFESADEGHSSIDKKERKSRLSSSNYSDQTAESDAEPKNRPDQKPCSSDKSKPDTLKSNDGWDDFDIDDDTDPEPTQSKVVQQPAGSKGQKKEENVTSVSENTHDTGWDDFDDWGQGDSTTTLKAPTESSTEDKIKDVTDRLAAASTGGNGGWGWGWGVDSLLSTATAGITTLTSQVSQGISTVLETSIGAPDPEELARQRKENDTKKSGETEEKLSEEVPKPPNTSDAQFPFGNLLSGVTKFVETTGTKVIAGGLDTLETIGKKTMEVLQDGDPGLTKKRAMLGLDHGDKPVLSQVLREAKTKADEEDRIREQKREAKEVHYETLFDDFEGLVHLEALEMLSRQISMRIEERMRGIDADKRLEIKETLQQVAELCEMPEEEEEEDEQIEGAKHEALLERLQTATQDVGIKIQFQPLVKQYKEVLTWLSTEATDRQTYKQAVSSLAQCTALTVEIYHKMAEMLIVKPRRSTADEADAVTQMTVVLTKHVSELATLFTEKLNSLQSENKEQINTYITNIFLEAGNSSTYIQNAFQLTLPILQIGAV